MSAAGRLNRLVTIERRTAASDGFGNIVGDNWASLLTNEPAEIRPLRGDEGIQAAKIEARGLYEVRVRYSSRTLQITEADRMKNPRTGQIMNIAYIENPDMRGKFLKIVCKTGGADG